MKQCQYYPQNNRNCSDCRMNMEQERGKSKIAIAAFDKYYLLLVYCYKIQLEPGQEFFRTTTKSGYVASLFCCCLDMSNLLQLITFIYFILLYQTLNKPHGDSQNFPVLSALHNKDCRQVCLSFALSASHS